jgi:tRNA A37 threonylcarbamoyladenosine dehydratase
MSPAQAPVPESRELDPRFDRFARLVGEEAIERLATSHVILFGVGGVGSFVAEALARSGVGHLILVDGERVCLTNLNRQLHALEPTLGALKVEAMAMRLRDINPAAHIEPVAEHYSPENAERLLPAGTSALVIDAIDTVTAKLHLLARCVHEKIPVLSAMGAAGRLDPTALRVSDLCESHTDQFAKDVRKYLHKRYGIDCTVPTGITAVWSEEPARLPKPLPYDSRGLPGVAAPVPGRRPPKCVGSAVFVTGVLGMTLASVAVERLLARDGSAASAGAA